MGEITTSSDPFKKEDIKTLLKSPDGVLLSSIFGAIVGIFIHCLAPGIIAWILACLGLSTIIIIVIKHWSSLLKSVFLPFSKITGADDFEKGARFGKRFLQQAIALHAVLFLYYGAPFKISDQSIYPLVNDAAVLYLFLHGMVGPGFPLLAGLSSCLGRFDFIGTFLMASFVSLYLAVLPGAAIYVLTLAHCIGLLSVITVASNYPEEIMEAKAMVQALGVVQFILVAVTSSDIDFCEIRGVNIALTSLIVTVFAEALASIPRVLANFLL